MFLVEHVSRKVLRTLWEISEIFASAGAGNVTEAPHETPFLGLQTLNPKPPKALNPKPLRYSSSLPSQPEAP